MTVASCAGSSLVLAADEALAWDAPPGCPDAQRVMAVVSELTGREAPGIAPFRSIHGRVERSGATWQLALTLRDDARQRSRVITAPSCEELGRAAGVAIALALDESIGVEPEAQRERDYEPPVGAEITAAESPPERSTAADAGPSPPSAIELEWRLQAEALLDGVALGSLAPGAGLSLGVRHTLVSGSVYGAFFPTQNQAVGSTGGSVEFWLLAGGARGCLEVASGWVGVDACAGLEVGRLGARGRQLENAATFSDWWLAPSLGFALERALGSRVIVRAAVDGLVPVLREAYRVDDGVLAHRAPSIGVRAGIALGIVLGGGG